MATTKGNLGSLSVGATVGTAAAVGELRSWEIMSKSDTVDASICGVTWRRNIATLQDWSGKASVFWDAADLGQDALIVGATVTLNLFPGGNGAPATDVYYTGTAVITEVSQKGAFDGLVEREISFIGHNALTESQI